MIFPVLQIAFCKKDTLITKMGFAMLYWNVQWGLELRFKYASFQRLHEILQYIQYWCTKP